MSVWAIVVAAGAGTRFGTAKQFEELGGRRVVDWSVANAASVAEGIVVVAPAGSDEEPPLGVHAVVAGGATRSASVRAGLAAVPADAGIVIVHDAARPMASAALFAAVVGAVRDGVDGTVPGLPVPDTIKAVDATGHVTATLERDTLVAVQTPQAFVADVLRRAHADGGEATDDAALVEQAGGRVAVVPGEPGNLKLTVPDDLARAREAVARS
ncbi:MAG TPA: 2-C-methyl-D-erythritol 4-phosphate cytidylyltransferase [Acidimicrobiales bacterium]|nr:2-C-methyl-D-erythritol 4-phosphate cytidylyltransferase [Acidimicrobiales bacterium]